jgi:hypothetical protein
MGLTLFGTFTAFLADSFFHHRIVNTDPQSVDLSPPVDPPAHEQQ